MLVSLQTYSVFSKSSFKSIYICAMAGIYIHIPFCKQRCSYCDFHFSTNLKHTADLAKMISKELILRKNEINEPVETIYFGGGTPSLLNLHELNSIFETVYTNYKVASDPEVTLEANPDDLDREKIGELKSTPVNRFSIGVQSFFDEDLRLMNRAHNSKEAIQSVKVAQDSGFENITIDLIYGGQSTTDEMWEKNLKTALDLKIPHISSYALTVEPKTVLARQIEKKVWENVDDEKQERQFRMLCETLSGNKFIQYEISNFGKEGFFSEHNSNYWKGKPYLGIGPSAHSFDGKTRSWNIANNSVYLKKMTEGRLPSSIEVLDEKNLFNELIMLRLRTIYGLNLNEMKSKFPKVFLDEFMNDLKPHLDNRLIRNENGILRLTENGKFLADGIAASLFRV